MKGVQDPYLGKVAAILHETLKPDISRQNAYGLAEECLGELQDVQSMLRESSNPREIVMAVTPMIAKMRRASILQDFSVSHHVPGHDPDSFDLHTALKSFLSLASPE